MGVMGVLTCLCGVKLVILFNIWEYINIFLGFFSVIESVF